MTHDILAGQSDADAQVPGAGLYDHRAGTVYTDTLDDGQREVLARALADAVAYRDPSGFCPGCEVHPAGLCDDHAAHLDLADAYLALGREFGIEADR